MQRIVHSSFDECFRYPFSAVRTGDTLLLRVFAEKDAVTDSVDAVKLRLWIDNSEAILTGKRFSCVYEEMSGYLFSFEAVMPPTPMLVWYYFIIETNEGTYYLCESKENGELVRFPTKSYQVTVYDKDFYPKKWFTDTIAYQIFPDRFRRGTKRGGLDRISAHTNKGRQVYIHDDWNDEVLYTPLPSKKHYAPIDFYGGDLKGIAQALPYLAKLNVGCIYLNPIFESPSNHRYDTANYMKIDPVLGDEADLLRLYDECRRRNIRIMLDGVFSHTGDDSVYFNRYCRYDSVGAYNSKKSEYYEWYDFIDFPDRYRSWWGFLNLPEVNEDNTSYREFIRKVIKKWGLLANVSWRLDVADELTDSFIEFLREQISPYDAVLIGEVWEDASNKQSYGKLRSYCSGKSLDGVMNYPFRSAVIDFLLHRITAYELAKILLVLQQNYPKPFRMSTLNILGSHDTVRIITALGDAPDRDALSVGEQAKYTLSKEQRTLAKKRLKQAVLLQFFQEGVPCIYYGDELGMEGMADPFCRRPFNKQQDSDEIFSFYKDFSSLRAKLTCLKAGSALYVPLNDDCFALIRFTETESAIALINRSAEAQEIEINSKALCVGECARDFMLASEYKLFGTKNTVKTENDVLRVRVEGEGVGVLVSV